MKRKTIQTLVALLCAVTLLSGLTDQETAELNRRVVKGANGRALVAAFKVKEPFDFTVIQQDGTATTLNTETLRTFLHHYLPSDDIDAIQKDTSHQLAQLIHNRLADSEIGNRLAHAAVGHAIGKMENSLLGLAPGAGHFAMLLAEPAESLLAKHINGIIGDHSEEIVRDLIANESQNLLDRPVCELLKDHDEQLQQLRTVIINAYINVINTRLPRILKAIDISRIVRDRINDMDMQEAEAIILSVMRHELRAIVWLGALLGCIIGTVNVLF